MGPIILEEKKRIFLLHTDGTLAPYQLDLIFLDRTGQNYYKQKRPKTRILGQEGSFCGPSLSTELPRICTKKKEK